MLPFCEVCHDFVEYTVKKEDKVKTIKDKTINYEGKEAYCNECNSPIFISEIRDYNLQSLDSAYRKEEGIISTTDIEKLLAKYNIGKRPLSLILGWGEITLTRFIKGDIPSKHYSDTLKRALREPRFLKELLEENKSKIPLTTYNACNKAISDLINRQINAKDGSKKKIDEVVHFFLVKCGDITPLSLQKLIYYAQSFNKVFNDEFLIPEDCEAWMHGPVYREVYYKYRQFGYEEIDIASSNVKYTFLSESEKELLDSVINNFGCYSGRILEKMTHMELPWSYTRRGLKEDEPSNRIIDKALIDEYFNDIRTKYNMLNISDIKDYSKDLFRKI